MSWCSDAPEDEAISLFAGLLANPDVPLSQVSRAKQVKVSLLPRATLTLQFCITSDCCRLLCWIVSPAQTASW
jgi:hypothetical protein